MKKETLKVTVRKKEYEVKYQQLSNGAIDFYDKENEKYSDFVYQKACESILDMIEKEPKKVTFIEGESNLNDKVIDNKKITEIEEVKENKEVTEEDKVNESKEVTESKKVNKDKKVTKTKKETNEKELLEKVAQLEAENKALRDRYSRVGRKSIGIKRTVGLTLPEHLWEHIDMRVRVSDNKLSHVLRDMLDWAYFDYQQKALKRKADKLGGGKD